MSTNPNANAFMRGYLRDPTNVTTRLVFADWLEEMEQPTNVAWARYIRLKAEADRTGTPRERRLELEEQASLLKPEIHARMTIPAALFVGYPKSLTQLLPAEYFTVRLGGFTPSTQAIASVRESAARSIPILPLDNSAGALIVAHPVPVDAHAIAAVRAGIAPDALVVGGIWDEIVGALNAAYVGMQEPIHFPPVDDDTLVEIESPQAYPVLNPVEFLNDVLRVGRRRRADLISFIPNDEVIRVFYRTPGGTHEAGFITRDDWRHRVLPEIIRRGEATGQEFSVEVVSNGSEQAIRIWPPA